MTLRRQEEEQILNGLWVAMRSSKGGVTDNRTLSTALWGGICNGRSEACFTHWAIITLVPARVVFKICVRVKVCLGLCMHMPKYAGGIREQCCGGTSCLPSLLVSRVKHLRGDVLLCTVYICFSYWLMNKDVLINGQWGYSLAGSVCR